MGRCTGACSLSCPPARTAEEAQLTPVVQEGGLGGRQGHAGTAPRLQPCTTVARASDRCRGEQ